MQLSDILQLFPKMNEQEMALLLRDLFGFQEILGFSLVHGGLMSQNYRVETDRGAFFLKQYRSRINTIIHEIKMAETFFAENHLPVITPIRDRYAREAFWMMGNWYSLFPFVESLRLKSEELTTAHHQSLANTIAHFHRVGHQFTFRPFQQLRVGTPNKFHLESVELMRVLDLKSEPTELDLAIRDLLYFKTDRVDRRQTTPMSFGATFDCLVHGDLQYNNVFFEKDRTVSHVFDFERTSLGWPPLELVRGMILNCFDAGWAPQQFSFAQEYISTYRVHHPLSFDEFTRAIKFYVFNLMMTTWIEASYLIYGSETPMMFFEQHKRRVHFFANANIEEFAADIFNHP